MNGINLNALVLLLPELILVGMALVLLVGARRLRSAVRVAGITVVTAVAAGVAAVWVLGMESNLGYDSMFTVDGYSQFFKVLITGALALTTLLSVRFVVESGIRIAEYHALLLLACTGMMVASSAVDLLTLYLGLELTTLCSYILVGITVDRSEANEAAIKYFLLGSFASALFLYGIALTYGVTQTTNYEGIHEAAQAVRVLGSPGQMILLAAVALLLAGLAFKVAAFPFHAWAPDAYQGAGAPVAAFLAAASKAAGLAALGRVCLVALDAEDRVVAGVLATVAALSILVGSMLAVSQTNMKRLLAYSSIAHAGYALLGFVAATSAMATGAAVTEAMSTGDGAMGAVALEASALEMSAMEALASDGAAASMTYALLYVFMTLGTFGVLVGLGDRGECLDDFQGLAAQRPGIAALMLLFLLSLAGIPPTAGFTAKFGVLLSVVRSGHWWLAVLAVLCSVITAFVYLRVAVVMYMKQPEKDVPARFSWAVSSALAVAALVTMIGGIFPAMALMDGIFPDFVPVWAVPPGN